MDGNGNRPADAGGGRVNLAYLQQAADIMWLRWIPEFLDSVSRGDGNKGPYSW